VRERFVIIGDLGFWLFAMVAMASTIVALARPQAIVSVVGTAGADLVILLDGSASMRVLDAQPNRWQRAVRWVTTLAETLSWREDRVALGLFAHHAAPQLRLTRDPNALFFFLDHLGKEPPFRLDVDTTWDTNIEAGLYWGLRLLDKNQELYGPSANAKAFVVVTDGQAWSGDVGRALEQTVNRRIPIYIVGVGTVAGGTIPEPAWPGGFVPAWAEGGPVHSELNRASLQDIARGGRGRYFELDREPDRTIALRIVQDVRRASPTGVREELAEVYWRFLLGAAIALGVALMFLRERTQLYWPAAAAVVAMLLLVNWAG
jgi:Ca-activated chloride channel family protein